MVDKLIDGAWKKSTTENHVCIGFIYGGHMGGECEIFLPKSMLKKFISDEDWAWRIMNRYGRIVYLASPDMNLPIPEEEKKRNGIVPDNWK